MEEINKYGPEFIEYFSNKISELVPHSFIAKQQSDFLNTTKSNLSAHEFLIISDFAENYTFTVQDEIQAFHWANQQCTIHPFCIYYKNIDGSLMNISLVVIAESLEHNYVAVHLFQTKLLEYLKKTFGAIKKIYFFSDGAASQYKNKKNFHGLCEIKKKHNIEVEWHFFATYHGKSACDAIGGTFKRMATLASLQRIYTNQMLSAEALYTWAQSTNSSIKTILCMKSEHDALAKSIQNKFHNVKTITGTQSYHCYIPTVDFNIIVKTFSFSEHYKEFNLIE